MKKPPSPPPAAVPRLDLMAAVAVQVARAKPRAPGVAALLPVPTTLLPAATAATALAMLPPSQAFMMRNPVVWR